jgi:hypothetical protein
MIFTLNLLSFVYHHEVSDMFYYCRRVWHVVTICLSSEGKWYVFWLWMYVTDVVSIIAVASYYCTMRIHDMSYNYFGVLLSQVGEKVIWLFQSALVDYVSTIVRCPRRGTIQLHTLGTEALDMHMHCICTLWDLFVSRFYVDMKWIRGVLFLFI